MNYKSFRFFVSALFLLMFFSNYTFAHCDGIDGPVVKSAAKALDTKNINLVFIWVKKDYEPELRNIFEKTIKVRELNSAAKELADMYFYETVVRLHRLGEGAAYTGLKPAGTDFGPIIPEADKAIGNNSLDQLSKLIITDLKEKLQHSFQEVIDKKDFKSNEIEKGREYVAAYVTFIHFAENIHKTVLSSHSLAEGKGDLILHED